MYSTVTLSSIVAVSPSSRCRATACTTSFPSPRVAVVAATGYHSTCPKPRSAVAPASVVGAIASQSCAAARSAGTPSISSRCADRRISPAYNNATVSDAPGVNGSASVSTASCA